MNTIPSIILPIIDHDTIYDEDISKLFKNKKVILFGVPGAYTPTCSEQHLPGFLELNNQIKTKNVDDIYCMSVNDKYVMKAWLSSYASGHKIKGIADGNSDLSKLLDVIVDKTSSFMGQRCLRFSMIIIDNVIKNFFVEDTEVLNNTSAENILKYI